MRFDINKIIEELRYDPNSVKKNYDGRTDIYMAKVSYRYLYFRRICVILLLIVIIAFILSGNLSYQKFYYLAKDIKLSSDYVSSVHDTITYNVGNSQSFSTYRGGLAVASREGFSIFSAGGRELFSANHSYGNPALATSERYVLLYDIGGKQFSLYNSFSKVSESTLTHSIYGASITKNGSFAIITKTDKYDSVVSVYKSNGTKLDYNFSEGRVISVSLSKNGMKMAVLLAFADGEHMRSEVRLYRIGSMEYDKADISFSGLPYATQIIDGGNIFVVGANGVNAFNANLNLVGEYLPDEEIYLYSFGKDNMAVSKLSQDATKTDIILLDKRGRIDKKYVSDERIIDILMYEKFVFAQKLGAFERINTVWNKTERIDLVATDFKMIASDRDTLIVCNESYAKFMSFGK